jgi:hypothetical protein
MKNQVGNQKNFAEKKYYLRNFGLFVHQGFYALDDGGKIYMKISKESIQIFFYL